MIRNLLRTAAAAAWCVLAVSLIELMIINTRIFSQPAIPVGDFNHAMKLSGALRYVTLEQERLHNLAQIASFGSAVVFVLAVFILRKGQFNKNSK
ncbi:MAG TPA: hypothetical protein VNW15_09345 [Rhizomicrobium sp.]|nr:hypothetical protein [Rhizomicrobium sp.]